VTFPEAVQANIDYLQSHRLWHVVSRNAVVRSCADAAQRRMRLGQEGIPLCDELKTGLGEVNTAGSARFVAVHCRGHQRLDEAKLSRALGGSFRRLTPTELLELFGAEKGLVNPFALAVRGGVQQVFDVTVAQRYFPPYTMMTNIGDLTYGVEFYPAEIIPTIEGAIIADIVTIAGKRVPTQHKFGILTGNGPESGILLWESLNALIRAYKKMFRGDISFPSVMVTSRPEMGLSMELADREAAVRAVVLDGARELCERGATVLAIACNTSQYFCEEVTALCSQYGAQFISIPDATASYLSRHGIQSFDFLGIGAVSDFTKWSGFGRSMTGFDVRFPSERNLAKLATLAYDIKREVVTGKTINLVRDVINQTTETDVVVLALTELSIVQASQKPSQRSAKRFVDTLNILAERMAQIFINEYNDVVTVSSGEED
jgi:aspartate/glutamate racemase/prolyl-tRNA editing enzyme YbaK/EbsC (Cys-tRNA(Pro) deacylase)